MRGNMFFIVLWMLCLDCSAASFLPKVHPGELKPFGTEDLQDADFKTLVAQNRIFLTEERMNSFLEYARSKNLNMEEKINYYLNYIHNIRNDFLKSETKNFEALKNFANGLLYDQGRYDTLQNRIKRHLNADHPPLTDQDRLYCEDLITVLDYLMNQGCSLLGDIKMKLPEKSEKLKPAYYELHIYNIFDLIEDTLRAKS
ncbi:MAG: hypothetical protein NEHIOOID_00717 [Holosporales bacterium]